LRRFLALIFGCAVIACAGFARAQEIDVAVGGSTLFSAKTTSASEAFQPPAMKGGVYTGASLQYVRPDHFGLIAEFNYRYKKSLYDGYQTFRPTLYDVNAVYARSISDRSTVHLMAGAGAQTTIFYDVFNTCTSGSGVCKTNDNSTHFLVDVGADLRYTVWRRIFLRPEIRYYRVFNNTQFHSGNLFRAGASIGYTFGR
jgi:hypothetical protein